MNANPALATLINPASAATQAAERLRLTAAELTLAGDRGKEPDVDSWLTIVQSERAQVESPPVGRMGPLLRTAGRVSRRASTLLSDAISGNVDSIGMTALFNAAQFASAARMLCWSLALRASTIRSEYDSLFVRKDAMDWARMLRHVYADTLLTQREFLSKLASIDWQDQRKPTPIRFDSDGTFVVSLLIGGDFMLQGQAWDVDGLAERLAAGTEVIF